MLFFKTTTPACKPLAGFLYGAILFAALNLPLNAGTIFSQAFPSSRSIDMADYRLTDDFTLTQASTITGINFWYVATQQTDLTTVSWAIYNSAGNAPGTTVIGSGSGTVSTSLFLPSVYLATLPTSSLNLAAGNYWLELHSGPTLSGSSGPLNFWVFSNDNATALALFNNGSGFPTSTIANKAQGYGQLAFELTGTTGASAVPEPATCAMLAAGLGLIALRKKGR